MVGLLPSSFFLLIHNHFLGPWDHSGSKPYALLPEMTAKMHSSTR
jgi:hypothetical protein